MSYLNSAQRRVAFAWLLPMLTRKLLHKPVNVAKHLVDVQLVNVLLDETDL